MTEKQIRNLVRKYRGLDTQILRHIAQAFEEGSENAPESFSQLPYEAQEEIYGLMEELEGEAQESIKEAYISGYESVGDHDKERASLLRALPLLYFASKITQQGQKAYQDTQKFTSQANDAMRISWQRAQSNAVNRAVEVYNKGGMTWLQAKQMALNELADGGVTHFIDRAGRSWEASAYVEMGVRTGIAQSARAGFFESMAQRGKDLFYISSHFGSCPLCAVWQGRIISISGDNPDYPSYIDAINDGLFHPNCGHVPLEYIEGFSDLRNDDSPESREYYENAQKQRYFERNLRKWKYKEAAAITPESRSRAKTYRQRWSNALKSHTESTGLSRKYYRESITIPEGTS